MATLKDLTDLMASSNLTEAQIADLISTLTIMQKENKVSKRGKKVVLSARTVREMADRDICVRIAIEPLATPMARCFTIQDCPSPNGNNS